MSPDRRAAPRIWDTDWLVLRDLSRLLAHQVERHLPRGAQLVDLGCGSMPYRPLMELHGIRYLGADLDRGADLVFRRRLKVGAFARYVVAMSANIPLAFLALWLWRDLAASRIEIAAPLASLSSIFVNFVLCRFAVFGRREVRTSLVHP